MINRNPRFTNESLFAPRFTTGQVFRPDPQWEQGEENDNPFRCVDRAFDSMLFAGVVVLIAVAIGFVFGFAACYGLFNVGIFVGW